MFAAALYTLMGILVVLFVMNQERVDRWKKLHRTRPKTNKSRYVLVQFGERGSEVFETTQPWLFPEARIYLRDGRDPDSPNRILPVTIEVATAYLTHQKGTLPKYYVYREVCGEDYDSYNLCYTYTYGQAERLLKIHGGTGIGIEEEFDASFDELQEKSNDYIINEYLPKVLERTIRSGKSTGDVKLL